MMNTEKEYVYLPKNEEEFLAIQSNVKDALSKHLDINLSSKRKNKLRDITATILGCENGYQQLKAHIPSNNDLFMDIISSAIRLDAKAIYLSMKSNILDVKLQIEQGKTVRERILEGSDSLNLIEDIKSKTQNFKKSWIFNINQIDYRISPLLSGQDNEEEFSLDLQFKEFKNKDFLNLRSDVNYIAKEISKHDSGLFLFSGTTGSGRSTTLMKVMQQLSKIAQSKIDTSRITNRTDESDLTFNEILKRVMRKDPDILCMGEIRDSASAQAAIEACKAGCTVLGTIHSSGIFGSAEQMTIMAQQDISEYYKGGIHQLLFRKKCQNCLGAGCIKCMETGTIGREPVIEKAFLNKETGKINLDPEFGHKTIFDITVEKYKKGLFDEKEIIRQLGQSAMDKIGF